MLKSILQFALATLITVPALAVSANAKEPNRKEFSACEVKTTRPYNYKLLYKNRKFLEGNTKRYSADIYKLNSKSPNLQSYIYNIKDKGKIVANLKFDYKPTKAKNVNPADSTLQTQTPPTYSNRIVWDTTFSACGPRPKDQSYPVMSYLFYDTYIGIKINGYRSPRDLGQVTTPSPLRLVNIINQLDGPDFGN